MELLMTNKDRVIIKTLAMFIKRLFDIIGGIFGIILLIPVTIGVLIAQRVNHDEGPIFYLHDRVGKNGKHFQLVKFRTMIVDADKKIEEIIQNDSVRKKEWETVRKFTVDPRVTKVGQFLRVTSLDELPNFLNVLSGSLSIVGPRPVMEDELERFGEYKDVVLSVKPGITGNWAVNGRSNTTYEERVALEVDYVKNWNLLTDIRIMEKTVETVIRRRGAK